MVINAWVGQTLCSSNRTERNTQKHTFYNENIAYFTKVLSINQTIEIGLKEMNSKPKHKTTNWDNTFMQQQQNWQRDLGYFSQQRTY